MRASACQLLLAAVLLASAVQCARVSQRLVGGHAKVDSSKVEKKAEEAPEEKKTLSQQVAEGKYGLIQKELFEKPPKRPGILSYEKNSEVPKDDENSLGGLGPDEIWLAEDHLLVLRGGAFQRPAAELPWPPLDDYRAPGRQVKIPSQPKVPPPFPVQLAEGGPLQLLGVNVTGAVNGTLTLPGGPDGAPPYLFPPPYQDPADAAAGRAPFPLPPYPGAGNPENSNKGSGPGPFPYPFPPPPPPNLNQSLDEDDPSIYYPPPYSFFYPKDNTSNVPPGPLVPGIVLPPPPDFFAPLDPPTTTTTTTTTTSTAAPPRSPPQRPTKPPIRYLPYDAETKPPTQHTVTTPATVPSQPHVLDFHEVPYDENELPSPSPVVPTEPYPSQPPRPHLRPTAPPPTNPTIYEYVHEDYNRNKQQPSRTIIPPFVPTAPASQGPRTYLRPTSIPVVQVSYGGGDQRPRTYLKPTSSPPTIANTVSSVPVLQVPYNDQRPRTYLKPTAVPQSLHTSPISLQYLPYSDRQKPTSEPPVTHTVSTVPVLRIPYDRAPPRTQVSSTAVPLKNFFNNADVDTNSVQPQAEYYYYEEENTRPPPPPQRLRYVAPTNFEKHVQQLRQQIQSYLKPSARPVYEYSFQAANYRPTRPPTRYLTPAPPQQYIQHRPPPLRYQQEKPVDQTYYAKHDDRYLDDITKKYFTVFGQKITTPVTPTHSLSGDTLVNYRKPLPGHNPDAEYINIRPQHQHKQKQQQGGPGTFISYQLPGEGAHFYFLTPQLVQQQQQQQRQQREQHQQQQQQQQNAYYYEKPENQRIPRRVPR